ncbi:MAG: hypothetical protein K2O16_03150 [Lachnospiraceae bacterium]|nr:hypothetical protein [Lachnospiraceae bacterium]
MKRLTVKIDDETYIPRALCGIGRDGEVDDYDGCADYCECSCEGECCECGIQHCFNRLAAYENMHEKIIKRIKEIKATSYFPHNFTGQMVEDLEWALSQIN